MNDTVAHRDDIPQGTEGIVERVSGETFEAASPTISIARSKREARHLI